MNFIAGLLWGLAVGMMLVLYLDAKERELVKALKKELMA